jgi:hypothetical protein
MRVGFSPLAAVLPLLLAGSGCSFAFVDGPPTAHADIPYFECSTSNALPIVDSVFAGSLAIGAAGAIADDNAPTGAAQIGVLIAETALFAWSAVRGFEKTAACREAKGAMIARLASGHRYAAPGRDEPPPDPWLNPPPGLFAPRTATETSAPDDAPAPAPNPPAGEDDEEPAR